MHHAHLLSGCYGDSPAAVEIEREIVSLLRGLIEKLLSMADCLIYESRLLIEDALEDSSLFTSSFRSSWSRKPQQFCESRHLSEQFELNMQLLGMEAYPEQREFVNYNEDSLQCFSLPKSY